MSPRANALLDDQSDTRRTILRAARELMQTRSYLGFSFQELADRVGIRKASLYHHFPSKEALAVEVFRRDMQRFDEWTASLAGKPPAEQVLTYIRMFRDLLGAGRRLCLGGALTPGWECIEPALQEQVNRLRRQQLDWLIGVLARVDGLQATGIPPAQWAAQLFALCQGAMISSRINGREVDFDEALAPFIRTLSLT